MPHRRVAIFGGDDDAQVRAVSDALRPHGIDPLVVRLIPDEIGAWDWGVDHLRRADGFDLLSLAAVYVRGFVMGYADAVGLDPRLVAESYMARYSERDHGPRRRLFGRS